MSSNSKIEWLASPDGSSGNTWNPIAAFHKETGKRGWFCVHAGNDCKFCYAEDLNEFRGTGEAYIAQNADHHTFQLINLGLPLAWSEPRAIFVNSMTDLFYEGHTFAQIAAIFGVMAAARQHTFLVLTKRTQAALRFFQELESKQDPLTFCKNAAIFAATGVLPGADPLAPATFQRALGPEFTASHTCRILDCNPSWPLNNVWLGASAGGQKEADERIPYLLNCPAALHWLSYEPALAPLALRPTWMLSPKDIARIRGLQGNFSDEKLRWVVIGGESGREARPFDVGWVRSVFTFCLHYHCPIFMKQMGSNPIGYHCKDNKGGDMDEWPDWLRVRAYPDVPALFLLKKQQTTQKKEGV